MNSKTSQAILLIGKNIREIRNKNNISQEQLALNAGLNRAYIGYIERCERNPSVETLEKIAKALKVKLASLFME